MEVQRITLYSQSRDSQRLYLLYRSLNLDQAKGKKCGTDLLSAFEIRGIYLRSVYSLDFVEVKICLVLLHVYMSSEYKIFRISM